ncbi:hypothetical protein [Undibacterium sp. Ji22W]|uniref:hypothetical protein n=1 Tax=Undibacterium sp. Ji22W TaxID=3413038 RepID=UPI003BF2ACFF
MKSTLTSKLILSAVCAVAVISAATAYQATQPSQAASSGVNITKQKMQKVTVAAKRMSVEEKLAFDLQTTGMQTVVISAKRLSPAQKLAMDAQDRAAR